ncbi:MAG: hypothetical protein AB1591_04720 [Pseudomonadota bacterium]
MSEYIVYLGTVGWEHGAWQGDFYPEGLPADWQLSFYNTQFRCVYLPFEQWKNATDEEVSGWLHDTREGFRFVLGTGQTLDESDRRKAARFGERGVLEGEAGIAWIEGEADLRDLARQMQTAAQGGIPLYLIAREATLKPLQRIGELMQVLGV